MIESVPRVPWGRTVMRWAAAGLAAAAVLAVLPAPASADEPEAEGVVIVGVPGLEWSDIDAQATPNLWELAGEGATGSMSVRTIGSWTCPESGWLSLGAGERAGGAAPRDAQCTAQSDLAAPTEDEGTWTVEDWDALVEANGEFNYGARLGSLADALAQAEAQQGEDAAEAEADGEEAPEANPGSCVAAIGDGAALAAADTTGQITYWAPGLDSLTEAMDTCDVVIVDPGVIVGDTADSAPDASTDYDQLGEDDTDVGTDPSADPEDAGEIDPEPSPVREAAAAAADEAVGQIRDALPDSWRLIVAGVSDSSAPSSLHPVVYSGDGIEAGLLTSAATGRDGYVQLTDLTATALAVTGADVPTAVAGEPMSVMPDGDHTAASAVAAGTDETRAATAVGAVAGEYYAILSGVGCLGVLAAAWLVLGSDKWRRTAQAGCVALAAIPVAGLAAGTVPWWRAEHYQLVFWAIILAGTALLTAVCEIPWLRRGVRRTLFIAGLTAALIAVDQVGGTTWPLHTPMGYTAQAGARYTGLGNYAFSVFAAAVILLVCFIPWRGRARYWGPVAIGTAATVIVGASTLGRDMGGTFTLVAAGILCCLKLWGRRLSVGAVAAAGAIAFAVFAIAGFLDYLRPEEDQTHLGRFVASVLDGSATQILTRKALASLGTIGTSMTWICLAALIAAVVIWRKRGRPTSAPVAAAVTGLTAVALIGALVNDSGIAIPGFTVALGFGLLALAVGPRPGPAAAPEREEAAT